MRSTHALLLASLFALVTPRLGFAKRKERGCDEVRPAQQLTRESQQAVDAAIQASLRGVPVGGGGHASQGSNEIFDVRLLSNDDLAHSWYTYQLCVLKANGTISDSMHEELMRKLWGVSDNKREAPVSSSSSKGASRALTATNNEFGVVATSSDRFIPKSGRATVIVSCAPKEPARSYRGGAVKESAKGSKSEKRLYSFQPGGRVKVAESTAFAVDVAPGLLQVSLSQYNQTVEFMVQDGFVYYLVAPYSLTGPMGANSHKLQLIRAREGREIVETCDQLVRE